MSREGDFKETMHGRLYPSLGVLGQVGVLFLTFLACLAFTCAAVKAIGAASVAAQTLVAAPFFLIFFLGYALWLARARLIALQHIGVGVLAALFSSRRRQEGRTGQAYGLPGPEKLEEVAVKVQIAASSFRVITWPVAILWAFLGFAVQASMPASVAAAGILIACLLWGHILTMLGRRGYLPIMGEE